MTNVKMAKVKIINAVLAAVVAVTVSPAVAHGPSGKGSAAFEAFEKGDVPARFKGLVNPLKDDPRHVAAGRAVYQESCVMCHGAKAEGNGHMAKMLEVKPADLRLMLKHFPDADAYYHWIISAGGADFDLPMPGFADQLSTEQIWQVVSWMQAGFPGAGTEVKDVMHDDHGNAGSGPATHMPGMPRHGMPGSKTSPAN